MPPRHRKPNPATQQIVPLLLLGIGLVTTNNSVTFLNDEATTLGAAVLPLKDLLAQSARGTAAAGFHPLFDAILHFWLEATGGAFDYLRIPSLAFLLAGLFLLGKASRRFAPSGGGLAVIWLGVLWPLSFHYGRLAAWYSFSFFLVSAVTLSYLEWLENRTGERAVILLVFCLALIWTTYWGWAILGFLAIDLFVRGGAKGAAGNLKAVAIAAVLLVIGFFPFFSELHSAVFQAVHRGHDGRAIFANADLNVFSLFVSSSLAPWYLRFSVPAGIAILACIILGEWWLPHGARLFMIYGACVLALMTIFGAVRLGDLLLLSPWVLMPLGTAVETTKPRWATCALAAALLCVGAAGWYGVYAKRFYSDPRFLEPWREIAADATGKIANGATVVSDQPAFLLYLTYDLHAPRENGLWRFEGVLPDAVTHQRVFSPQGWLATPRVAGGNVVLVRSGREPGHAEASDDVARQLDASCGSISSRLRVRDPGYAWKQRYLPQLHEPLWRIEIRDYDCGPQTSK